MGKKNMTFSRMVVEPVIQPAKIRRLCVHPYPNHKHGCPNYGKRTTCPPDAPLFGNMVDLAEDVWFLWATFNIGEHVKRMQIAHPTWTHRQNICCLYWQGTVRKFLREECLAFVTAHEMVYPDLEGRLLLLECPEAMGVNVTATMEKIGVHLEWPPKHYTRMVYVMGVAR